MSSKEASSPEDAITLAARVWQSFREGSFGAKLWNRARWEIEYGLFHLPEIEFIGAHDISDVIHEDICLPPFYAQHKHDDVTPLVAILKTVAPQLVIELGTAHGNLTANICRLTDARVITVNALAEQMTGHWVSFALSREEIGRVYRQHGFEKRVTQVYEDTLTLDLREYLAPSSADLCIIDACHDLDYVVNDFNKVVPFIRPGGIILFHDTHPAINREMGGSYRACMHLRRRGWDIYHIKGTWWGIWIREGISKSNLSRLLVRSAVGPLWNYLRPMH
jgi:predicted O-methyltransferase YrrM